MQGFSQKCCPTRELPFNNAKIISQIPGSSNQEEIKGLFFKIQDGDQDKGLSGKSEIRFEK